MALEWMFDRFREHEGDDAVVWRDRTFSYRRLLVRVDSAREFLREHGVTAGHSTILDADFSPTGIALLLAAIAERCITVPVAANVTNLDREAFARIAEAGTVISVNPDDSYAIRQVDYELTHPLLVQLREQGSPGFVMFTSGSTGEPKGAVHDFGLLLNKFKVRRHTQRLITFLLFDHVGGVNTLFYALSNAGCAITLEARDVDTVCRAIQQHRAEVLPTSPTFLALLLLSGAHERYDLSSLKIVNYATEVMPDTLLGNLNRVLPGVEFRQSYGLTEIGIMRSKSRSSTSAWVKVGGEDYRTRVVAGMLQIKAKSSMAGYLNADSPFTDDGWFQTGDEVEVDGEWLRFKGRKSDIINVGGEKVYPAEVESVIMEVNNVSDATVMKEAHPFTGNIVVAEVSVKQSEDIKQLARRVRAHCFSRLPAYKVPVKIRLAERQRVSERFKKDRLAEC
jgi:acyl-coenzyme A synthetase/AMP-(fatty) acid ligase